MAASKLRITWKKSWIGYPRTQRATIRALGLHRLSHTVEHLDNPAIRGMVYKVRHMVQVEEVQEETPPEANPPGPEEESSGEAQVEGTGQTERETE